MSNSLPFLRRLFFQKPLAPKGIFRKQNIINSVIPNLYQNLFQSSKAFINAVVNQDLEFLQATTSPQLFKCIQSDIQEIKNQGSIITISQLQDEDTNQQKTDKIRQVNSNRQIFVVFPYVKFGVSLKKGYQYPGNHKISFGKNKFLFIDPKKSFLNSIKAFETEQIYGFNCLYKPKLPTTYKISGRSFQDQQLNYSKMSFAQKIVTRASKLSFNGQYFCLTFQTDANNLDFVIQDVQDYIKNNLSS